MKKIDPRAVAAVKWERDQAFWLLGEIAEFLEDQLDVVDGSYGEQKPNRAMSLHTQIELLIGKLP